MVQDTSVHPTPQAPLAGVQVEPDVPTVAPTVRHDDPSGAPDPTTPLRCAAGPSIDEPIGKRIAAIIARPTRDFPRACHRLSDAFLAERVCHMLRIADTERTPCRPIPRGNSVLSGKDYECLTVVLRGTHHPHCILHAIC
jgi:hypothetical protein